MKLSILLITISCTLSLTMWINSVQAQDTTYGWQLMTEQERVEHRKKMRSFRTEQERDAYRSEHHKRMQERAKEQGIALPEVPQHKGKGMGSGKRCGGGQGMGGGRNR